MRCNVEHVAAKTFLKWHGRTPFCNVLSKRRRPLDFVKIFLNFLAMKRKLDRLSFAWRTACSSSLTAHVNGMWLQDVAELMHETEVLMAVLILPVAKACKLLEKFYMTSVQFSDVEMKSKLIIVRDWKTFFGLEIVIQRIKMYIRIRTLRSWGNC